MAMVNDVELNIPAATAAAAGISLSPEQWEWLRDMFRYEMSVKAWAWFRARQDKVIVNLYIWKFRWRDLRGPFEQLFGPEV